MSLNIKLPPLNGDIEAGITFYGITLEESLPDEQKLPILATVRQPATHEMIKYNALIWAFPRFNDPNARKLYVNGIAAILDLGLVCKVDDIPDGDWILTHTKSQDSEAAPRDVVDNLNIEEMKKAATIVIATKADYWSMNNHTGQGAVYTGYTKKVLDRFFERNVTEQVVSATHRLGCYASTLKILHIAGKAGLREAISYTHVQGASIKLSQDVKLKFELMPAGTHRLDIAYETVKRLIRSVYGRYCPNLNDFIELPERRRTIMDNPVPYHIRASYLTGLPKADYNDMDMENYLGRLGTFITTLYKNSTLAKSPHFTLQKIESYPDYDAGFKRVLIRIKQAQATAQSRIPEEQFEQVTLCPAEIIHNLKAAYSIT